MNPDQTTSNPSLQYRAPLYPAQFLVAMAVVSLGPLLDPMMSDLGVPLARGGLVSAGLYIGNVSGIVILNTIVAAVPIKRTLLSAITLQGMALITAGLAARNLWSLFAIYLFVGAGGSIMNTSCWIWLSSHMKRNTAAYGLQMILFFGLAMIAVPLILGILLDQGATWRWILVAEGCLSLVTATTCAFLPLLEVPGRQNVRLAQFKEVIAYKPGLVLGMMGAGFAYVGAEMTLNVWLPKFEIDTFKTSAAWASLSVTLFWVGLVAGRLIVMPLTRRYSAARLLLACACILAVFTIAIAVAPSQAASLVLAVGAGLGASASYALIGSYAGRFPGWHSGVASSLFILSGGVGGIVFPYLMGPLADSAGFRVALAMVAVPAVVYALFSLLIHSRADEGGRRA